MISIIIRAFNYLNNLTFMSCFLDSMGLNRVGNPSKVKGAISLHLYSPPISSYQIFDEDTGAVQIVNATFYSVNGKRCPK